MIYVKELCPFNLLSLPQEHEWNLMRLYWCLNVIRREFNSPMIVTSGYRTEEQHEEIYHLRNEALMKAGKLPVPVPMGSMHLCGAAADISDPEGVLKKWILEHLDVLQRLDLYCEAFDATPGWVHFQIFPPESGRRFFEP